MLVRVGDEVRLGRIAAGLSQQEVARTAGISRSKLSKIESHVYPALGFPEACALLAVVGKKLAMSTFPYGSPYRDAGHKAVLDRLREATHRSVAWRTEVPLPNPGDLRSWDAICRVDLVRAGVEVETRPRDGQELLRRLTAKRRDGGVDRVILLLADTRSNRAFVRDWRKELAVNFPVPGRVALKALREGRDPGGDAVILI